MIGPIVIENLYDGPLGRYLQDHEDLESAANHYGRKWVENQKYKPQPVRNVVALGERPAAELERLTPRDLVGIAFECAPGMEYRIPGLDEVFTYGPEDIDDYEVFEMLTGGWKTRPVPWDSEPIELRRELAKILSQPHVAAIYIPAFIQGVIEAHRKKKAPKPKNSLADTVKAWRKKKNLTAERAAQLLSMSVRTLRDIEAGRKYSAEGPLRLAIKYLEKHK